MALGRSTDLRSALLVEIKQPSGDLCLSGDVYAPVTSSIGFLRAPLDSAGGMDGGGAQGTRGRGTAGALDWLLRT